MTPLRLFAVFVIVCFATVAWVVLGAANSIRSEDTSATLTRQVGELWGEPQTQQAPTFRWTRDKGSGALEIAGSDIDAAFDLQPRRKGLLWYATYGVDFAAVYRVSNPETSPVSAHMTFAFPTPNGAYDGFAVSVDGKDVPVTYKEGEALATFPIAAGRTAEIRTGYVTQGLDEWRYEPSPGVGVIKDFRLTMKTNFTQVDYPVDAVSPSSSKVTGTGMELTWDYASLVSGRPVALVMPKPTNPGPLASRISLFAPVSLLFFFAALVLLTATSGLRLHPMHYGFLAAGFFAFHLLFSYLVDRVDINLSFLIASLTSVALVVGYLSVVVGRNRALVQIALSQMVFLVLFSYSFFFEGLTGLAITIGSVLTLAHFMVMTAKVDWDEVFRKAPKEVPQAAVPAAPTPAPTPSPGPGLQA